MADMEVGEAGEGELSSSEGRSSMPISALRSCTVRVASGESLW